VTHPGRSAGVRGRRRSGDGDQTEFGGGVGGPARNRSPCGVIDGTSSAINELEIPNTTTAARSAKAGAMQTTGDTQGAAPACGHVVIGAFVTSTAVRGALGTAPGHFIASVPAANTGVADGRPNAANITTATSRRAALRIRVLMLLHYSTRAAALLKAF
jgi:hypothetical protein